MIKKKGSALLMVLIALVVLSLIGTAIISYSTSNYKLRDKISDNYENRYIAEGGIDQAYGAIILLLNNSEKKNDIVNNLNKIAGNSISDDSNGYYADLKNGELRVIFKDDVTPSFSGDLMLIELVSNYKSQNVIGKFKVTYNDDLFSIELMEKSFK